MFLCLFPTFFIFRYPYASPPSLFLFSMSLFVSVREREGKRGGERKKERHRETEGERKCEAERERVMKKQRERGRER